MQLGGSSIRQKIQEYFFHWLIGKLLDSDWTELLLNIRVSENLSLPQ